MPRRSQPQTRRLRPPAGPSRFSFSRRAAGVLMHITSLPGPHGSGDLGPAAYEFVDFLHDAGQTWWQTLPINPTAAGNSPYSALSALAGNPLLINLDALAADELLTRRDLAPESGLRADRVDFDAVVRFRLTRLRRAFAAFRHGGGERSAAFTQYVARNREWLEPYALFAAIRQSQAARTWMEWPRPLKLAEKAALDAVRKSLADEIAFQRFVQHLFDTQWTALRCYAHENGVGLIGDIPIFVGQDSADVWAHRELFLLEPDGRPKVVSGCPPDSFSKQGQLWQHPHYRWERHHHTHFAWWISRFRHTLAQFDAVRIDHFLGFHRVWAVPGGARNAVRGTWLKTPGDGLLTAVRKALGPVEIIAEDLGLVTPEALALREKHGLPGMRILQCAFGDDDGCRYHQPHAYPHASVVYTGTHDNDTVVGWWRSAAKHAKPSRKGHLSEPDRALRYLAASSPRDIHWHMIRAALASPAATAIVPTQDLLGLDSRGRMNVPAIASGNWEWRMTEGALSPELAARLRDLSEAYGRI
ncbi:4-alpha-glucanotransferase [Phycisphaerae bacterium RAS1]|nr:4-alpha-glucanotransferase [Phycisphaerae bacterium RAS1]